MVPRHCAHREGPRLGPPAQRNKERVHGTSDDQGAPDTECAEPNGRHTPPEPRSCETKGCCRAAEPRHGCEESPDVHPHGQSNRDCSHDCERHTCLHHIDRACHAGELLTSEDGQDDERDGHRQHGERKPPVAAVDSVLGNRAERRQRERGCGEFERRRTDDQRERRGRPVSDPQRTACAYDTQRCAQRRQHTDNRRVRCKRKDSHAEPYKPEKRSADQRCTQSQQATLHDGDCGEHERSGRDPGLDVNRPGIGDCSIP